MTWIDIDVAEKNGYNPPLKILPQLFVLNLFRLLQAFSIISLWFRISCWWCLKRMSQNTSSSTELVNIYIYIYHRCCCFYFYHDCILHAIYCQAIALVANDICWLQHTLNKNVANLMLSYRNPVKSAYPALIKFTTRFRMLFVFDTKYDGAPICKMRFGILKTLLRSLNMPFCFQYFPDFFIY